MATRKALLGGKIRHLRHDRALTQQQLAERLGISPSYLNLIEHNERPVTVPLLLKLAATLQVDLQDLSVEDERRLAAGLVEVFRDGGLAGFEVGASEAKSLAETAPRAAKAVVELYRAYRSAREDAQALGLALPSGRRLLQPEEEARDFFYDRANHFPGLEEAAEALWAEAKPDPAEPAFGLARYLAERHGIVTAFGDRAAMAGQRWRLEKAAGRLVLADTLPRASRAFSIAYHASLIAGAAEVDRLIDEAKLSSPETRTLARVGLVNYMAAALLMPYRSMLAAAQTHRYDIDLLASRFGTSFEQTCHRLTTLQRPGAKGVPFYLVRVDVAGNISKRFSASGFHFSRVGGSCPRWIVHEAFTTPGLIRTQVARLPDGTGFFSIARALARDDVSFGEPRSHLAIGIGCDLQHAGQLVYADGYDLDRLDRAVEIGIGCRLCERPDCSQRAFPPLKHRLVIDAEVKGASPYSFSKVQPDP